MMKKFAHIVVTALAISGCATKGLEYPANQTSSSGTPRSKGSEIYLAKDIMSFQDHDINVPAYFDTQGLGNCTFNRTDESDACPLKKPVIRVYFDGNRTTGEQEKIASLAAYSNDKLSLMLENQMAGLNRFRIITKDDASVNEEIQRQAAELGNKQVARSAYTKRAVQPDYLLKVDTIKSANFFYGEYNGVAGYTIEMTVSIIDPYTKEKLSHPNIGKIRVKSSEVWEHDDLVYVDVSNRYYSGFNYANAENVQAVYNDMISRAYDVMVTRLLSEMPSTAQVMGIKGNQISLDRGQNAGVLPNETMVVFSYASGFVDPLGVAQVNPSKNSGNGIIIRWKESAEAKSIQSQAANGIFRPKNGSKLFAVSVGTPSDFINKRM